VVITRAKIGDQVEEGQLIAEIDPQDGNDNFSVVSPFSGMLRGLIRPDIHVAKDMKIGDVDRRHDPAMHTLVSDKALAIGGAVLEALLMFLKSTEKSEGLV
jgi:xanthine dehydrogenase accessory factor